MHAHKPHRAPLTTERVYAKDAATIMLTEIFMSPEYGPAASLSKKMSPDGQGRCQAEKIMPTLRYRLLTRAALFTKWTVETLTAFVDQS
jgi:hypothetical protein